jgi:hypothetical protein
MKKKKILFITSNSMSKAFKNEIELLEKNYECHVVSSLYKAQKIVQSGIYKVVIYPFYIALLNYEIPVCTSECFAGYYFWKQELAQKGIPTIVVNFHVQPDFFIKEIIGTGWKENLNVTFFDYNGKWQNVEELVELIKT